MPFVDTFLINKRALDFLEGQQIYIHVVLKELLIDGIGRNRMAITTYVYT